LSYCLGRLPEDWSKPRLTLAPHLRAVVPPASVDWYSRVQAWGVLANDQWGDCVFAGNGHIIEQQTALGGGDETIVTDQEALAEYSAVTGFNPDAGPSGSNPTDQGALIQDGLADLRKNGLAGQKIAAFARVSQADQGEVKTALAELGAVSLGVNLPQSAMDQFDAGQPWTVSGDGTILGGHCITAFGYDAEYVYVVSWGKVVPATWEWLAAYCDEAWAVVSAMWAGEGGKDPEGVDLPGLGEEFAALTGEANPFPAPQPVPVPPPPAPEPPPAPPAPDPAAVLEQLAETVRAVAASAQKDITELLAFLASHGL
jgi:hypothetical protein